MREEKSGQCATHRISFYWIHGVDRYLGRKCGWSAISDPSEESKSGAARYEKAAPQTCCSNLLYPVYTFSGRTLGMNASVKKNPVNKLRAADRAIHFTANSRSALCDIHDRLTYKEPLRVSRLFSPFYDDAANLESRLFSNPAFQAIETGWGIALLPQIQCDKDTQPIFGQSGMEDPPVNSGFFDHLARRHSARSVFSRLAELLGPFDFDFDILQILEVISRILYQMIGNFLQPAQRLAYTGPGKADPAKFALLANSHAEMGLFVLPGIVKRGLAHSIVLPLPLILDEQAVFSLDRIAMAFLFLVPTVDDGSEDGWGSGGCDGLLHFKLLCGWFVFGNANATPLAVGPRTSCMESRVWNTHNCHGET